MSDRDYGDVPVGELDAEEHEVPQNTDYEAYIDKSLDEVIEEQNPSPPIEKLDVEWVDPSDLVPNDWNPNHMPDHREDMLVLSILDNGWTQPVVARPDDVIVDGEHRWKLSKNEYIQNWPEHKPEGANDLTPDGVPAGFVPVHRIDTDRNQSMIATYQQNYARGDHDPDKLGALVDSLDEEEQDFAATRMGVTNDELEMLLPDSNISDDATELWETPWDDDLDHGEYTDRLAFDMIQEEAQLVRHIFGADGTAEPLVKLCRFILTTNLWEEVEEAPTPDLAKADGGEDDE